MENLLLQAMLLCVTHSRGKALSHPWFVSSCCTIWVLQQRNVRLALGFANVLSFISTVWCITIPPPPGPTLCYAGRAPEPEEDGTKLQSDCSAFSELGYVLTLQISCQSHVTFSRHAARRVPWASRMAHFGFWSGSKPLRRRYLLQPQLPEEGSVIIQPAHTPWFYRKRSPGGLQSQHLGVLWAGGFLQGIQLPMASPCTPPQCQCRLQSLHTMKH